MAGYQGDIHLGDTIDVKFVTTSGSTGAPTTLSGSPAVAAYVDNGTTEITAGITLSVDFDSRTGLNNVRVVASGGNGFAAQTNVSLVITAGTVGGTSAVGYEVGSFSIDNRVADVRRWNGTAVATPATAGIPDVNAKNINNVATTSVTTISANVGTTQPLNFTGSAGSATVKSDVTNIAAAAVSTSAAQIGVNVVNFGGSAGTFSGGRPEVNTTHLRGTLSVGAVGYVGIDWSAINAPTTVVALSGTTIASLTNAPTAGDFTAAMKTSLNAATPVATLSSAYDPAKTAAQAGDIMKVSSGTGANQISLSGGAVSTVTTLTNAPADSAGVTTLLTRVPSAITISGGIVSADIKKVNAVTVQGTGVVGDSWRPV